MHHLLLLVTQYRPPTLLEEENKLMLCGSVLVLISVVVLICVRRSHQIKSEILSVLLRYGEMYGLQIVDKLQQDFGKKPGWGVLYPELRRLERQGYVRSRWGNERSKVRGSARRRYYLATNNKCLTVLEAIAHSQTDSIK